MIPQIDYFSKFEEWWENIGSAVRSTMDMQTAQTAFVAGCRTAKQPPKSTAQNYRFVCGKRRVTVTAESLTEAKAKASDILNRRAEKLTTSAPVGGWKLSLVKAAA